jgi:integrase
VAVDWGYLRVNPFKAIKAPKLETRRWHYLTLEQYKRLLEVAPDNYRKAFYSLAYTAGLRFGELCSLTWADIDFQKSEVHVCSKSGTSTLPPFLVKDHEMRVIPLPQHTMDILSKLHAEAPVGVPYVLIDKKR